MYNYRIFNYRFPGIMIDKEILYKKKEENKLKKSKKYKKKITNIHNFFFCDK